MKEGRALPDGQVQSFDVGSIQFHRILGVAPCLFPPPGCTHAAPPLHFDNAIVPPRLDDLAVQTSCPKNAPDDVVVKLESVRGDQRNSFEFHSARNISKQTERVSVAPSPNHSGRPEPRPDVDRNKDPDRLLLAAHHRADLIGLQLCDLKSGNPSIIESATGGGGFLQPAIHGVPGNLLDSGNRRFVYTLDAESGDFIERCSAMLQSVIDCSPVPAEGPAAHLASEPTAFAPAGWVKTKTNDHSQRGFCSQ